MAEAAARLGLATLYWRQDDYQTAIDHLRPAVELAKRAGWPAGQAAALGNLGVNYLQTGRLRESAERYAGAFELYGRIGSDRGEASGGLGEVQLLMGRLDDALDHLTRALALHRDVGDQRNELNVARAIAAVHRDAGRHAAALDGADTTLAIARDIGERRVETDLLNVLGTVHMRLGPTNRPSPTTSRHCTSPATPATAIWKPRPSSASALSIRD
jgi:tetratricopeptide (TPR) repeat protein